MIEPDLLKIQRRALKLFRASSAELSQIQADIQRRSIAEQERARSDSNRLKLRINDQVGQAMTAFAQAKDQLNRRGLRHLVQMAPISANSVSSSQSDPSRRLKELVGAINASVRRMNSCLDALDRTAEMTPKIWGLIGAAALVLVLLALLIYR